ncbi:MAG TPA: hypothetical protein VFY13_10355 [Luteolibacter sp.]|nr:hypothetical protein [Luteolibacter sp.]
MDALIFVAVALAAAGATWLLIVAVDTFTADDREIDELTLDAIETLRQIIERETGREVAELFLHGGHWHAVTARGPVMVSELLKSGYVRVGRD